MSNHQPTTPYPAPHDLETVPTYALAPGERVWTQSGPREVVAVELGAAGGWRWVRFSDGMASVVYSQPWTVVQSCGASRDIKGERFTCTDDDTHTGPHTVTRAGELIAAWKRGE